MNARQPTKSTMTRPSGSRVSIARVPIRQPMPNCRHGLTVTHAAAVHSSVPKPCGNQHIHLCGRPGAAESGLTQPHARFRLGRRLPDIEHRHDPGVRQSPRRHVGPVASAGRAFSGWRADRRIHLFRQFRGHDGIPPALRATGMDIASTGGRIGGITSVLAGGAILVLGQDNPLLFFLLQSAVATRGPPHQ